MDNLTPITREEMLLNDEPLTPITREEKILAGEDLNPVTRREYFLKKYRHAGGDVMVEGLEVTANGTYTAPEGKAYSPVEVAVPLPDNAYLLKTASGSLVSFSDGADLPMPSFVCNIDAVQDLHGYDGPWVGGAGKNKAEPVENTWSNKGITATKNDDGSYSITGTATENVTSNFLINVYPISAGEEYIVTNKKNQTDTATKYTRCVCSFYNDSTYKSEINVNEGQTITVPSNANRIRLSYVWNNGFVVPAGAIIYPMIRLATETDPTFAPYSNICPISGHTGVDAVISPTTEASAGTTYSVSWQTEAGEVFGGYVDLVSGVLTVLYELKRADWLIWQKNSSDVSSYLYFTRSLIDLIDIDKRNTTKSNATKTMTTYPVSEDGCYVHTTGVLYLNFLDAIGTNDLTSFNNFLTTENITLLIPVETPQICQLTPQQIKSLLGYNNAWCDTGDVTSEYFGKEVTG